MQSSLVHKFLAGLGIIIGIGILSMIITYSGLTNIKQALQTISEIEEPGSAAAYEMEINAIGTGMGVLNYLHTGDAIYLDRVAKDKGDFERYLAQYQQVTDSAEERVLGEKIARMYQEYKDIGETLINKKDQQDRLSAAVAVNFQNMYDTIDELLHTSIAEHQQDDIDRLKIVMTMNTIMAQVSSWLGSYLWISNPQYRERIYDNTEKFWEKIAEFQRHALNSEEERRLVEIKTGFQQIEALIKSVLALTDTLQENVHKFLKLRAEMDEILDEQIQALKQADMNAAKESADWAADAVMQTVGVAILVFFLIGLSAALLIIRTVKGPLQELKNGTKAVIQGELGYRLRVKGRDEFAQMATRFNHMVAKLEATTVSKKRLKMSQQKLHIAYVHLQKESVQRKQTEKSLQALSRQLLNAQEQERRRIAHELHDEIGQALSAIMVNLEAIELKPEPATIAQRLRDTIGVADSTLQQVRNLSLDLRPSMLDDLGLAAALRWHLDQQAQRTGFVGQFVADTLQGELNPDIKVTCFRIAQEALTNVVRHAQAQHVMVEIDQLDHELKLSIRDDGVGFDVDKAWKTAVQGASLGVLGMQERAQLAGGQLVIDSAPGRGTDVHASLPLS